MLNCFIVHLRDDLARAPQIAIADLTGLGEMVPGTMTITRINVPAPHRGRGHGSRLLGEIGEAADKENIALSLEILPSGPLDYDALREWYHRFGFRPSPKYPGIYVRRPHGPHQATPVQDA